MIDTRKTLTNLHTKFPEFDLDTLFEIVDSIEETYVSTITSPNISTRPISDKPWWEDNINRITYTYNTK